MGDAPNTNKGDRYRFAWDRIDEAMNAGFYLEAITICESMITDRLISFAMGTGRFHQKKPGKPTLGSLLHDWSNRENDIFAFSCTSGEKMLSTSNLLADVKKWKNDRNEMLHELARSVPGTAPTPLAEFWSKAKPVAEEGRRLARLVLQWHKSELARSKKAGIDTGNGPSSPTEVNT